MTGVSRRNFLTTAAAGTAPALLACAPGSVPAPSPAPVAPPAGAPQSAPVWQREWDLLVEAAKREGKLSILTLTGTGYRKALDEFERAFGITVDHTPGASSSIYLPKIEKEREAGIYNLDVLATPPNNILKNLRPIGALAPVRPLIFRPDVLDDKVWREGFEAQFMDKDKQLAFSYDYQVTHTFLIDTTQVKPGELKNVRDLLDPRWKGKIAMADVRSGATYLPMSAIRLHFPDGDDIVKRLLVDQQPSFSRDTRSRAEGVVRSKFAIGSGVSEPDLKQFREQGLTGNVQYLDWPEVDVVFNYSIFFINRAPHPNAAKLFVNWVLTKEGQTIWTKNVPTVSARTDVESYDPSGTPAPGRKYYASGRETLYDKQIETQKMINDLVGITN